MGLLDEVGLADRLATGPVGSPAASSNALPSPARWVADPPLLLADEPTAHLDHIQVETVLRLMRSLARPGRLVVVATHDDRVSRLADAVIELGSDRAPARRRTDPGAPCRGGGAVQPG